MQRKRNSIKITSFLLMVTACVFLIVGLTQIVLMHRNLQQQALHEAELKRNILLDHNLAIHTYFSHKLKPTLFALTEDFVSEDYFEPVWMSSTYAVREIDKIFRTLSGDHYYYKESAVNARFLANEADEYEREFLERLNQNPEVERQSGIREIDGQPYFVAMRRGEKMEADCLRCHSVPKNAPQEMVEFYGPERSFQRKVGETISAISVRVPLADAFRNTNRLSLKLSFVLFIGSIALFVSQSLVSDHVLFSPLRRIRDYASQIAENDEYLGQTIPPPFGRELKDMTAAFNVMSVNLQQSRQVLKTRNLELTTLNVQLQHEIEHRKATEQELLQHQEHLEALVQKRTAELTKTVTETTRLNHQFQEEIVERTRVERERENLIHELERKNSELERFTYTVSHDLKSPLITIKGFLNMLKQDVSSGDTKLLDADIHNISTATDKMHELLVALLELSRAGRAVNLPENISLKELIDDALLSVAGHLTERAVQVRVAPDLPVVHGDRVRLRTVFENLFDNAAKFMGEQPEPQMEVGIRRTEEETTVFVKDNGIGIDAEFRERVFGLFQQVNTEAEGTGIGLATVKRIVELHGGRIWVESEGVGKGSTFWLTLPMESKTPVYGAKRVHEA